MRQFIIYQEILIGVNINTYFVNLQYFFQETNLIPDLSTN